MRALVALFAFVPLLQAQPPSSQDSSRRYNALQTANSYMVHRLPNFQPNAQQYPASPVRLLQGMQGQQALGGSQQAAAFGGTRQVFASQSQGAAYYPQGRFRREVPTPTKIPISSPEPPEDPQPQRRFISSLFGWGQQHHHYYGGPMGMMGGMGMLGRFKRDLRRLSVLDKEAPVKYNRAEDEVRPSFFPPPIVPERRGNVPQLTPEQEKAREEMLEKAMKQSEGLAKTICENVMSFEKDVHDEISHLHDPQPQRRQGIISAFLGALPKGLSFIKKLLGTAKSIVEPLTSMFQNGLEALSATSGALGGDRK